MLRFKKRVSKFGKVRRIVEIPMDYYDIVKVGDIITIIAKEKCNQ